MMDGITAYALVPELNDALCGALLERIAMEDRHTLTLSWFTPKRKKYYLTLCSNPTAPYIRLSVQSPSASMNPPPAFAMYLRKHLRRARLLSVTTPPWERVFVFGLLAVDDLGDERELTLIFECMPRTANIVLLNRDEVIMGAARHIDHRVNRVREILPAHPYVPPPPQQRRTVEAFLQLSQEAFYEPQDQHTPVGQAVTRSVAGFSPVLGDEVAFRAGIDPRMPLGTLDALQEERLFTEAQSLCRSILKRDFHPAVYYDTADDGRCRRPRAVHAVPLTHLQNACSFDRLFEAQNVYVAENQAARRFDTQRQSLEKRIADKMKHSEKKRSLHEKDLAEGEEADADRLKGELILAYIHSIPKGADTVTLDNYYADGDKVICSLDPTKTPQENANRYFHKAKRKKRKWEAAQRLLAEDVDTLSWLSSLATALRFAESEEDLSAIRQELLTDEQQRRVTEDRPLPQGMPGRPASKKRRQQGASGSKKSTSKTAPRAERPLTPRRFRSSDGFILSSGRNNLQNDQLLRKASRDDLWFHVKNQPGSHVIIAAEGREIPENTIVEAAGITAWYSGAGRTGVPVEVDYCAVRDVKKIPATKPGNVSYKNFKTLYIKPLDPNRLETL